jgi:N-acetylglucosamine-6-phosphate deacetylase
MKARVAGRVVTPDGVHSDGYVDVADGRITWVGHDAASLDRDRPEVHRGHTIVPGFVDLHCHGGAGNTFTTGDARQARRAAAFHLAHGTTTLLASTVSAPHADLLAALRAYGPLVADGTLAGVHLEGPYLAPARCGAQNPAHLRDPEPAELASLLDSGAGTVRMVTLAPELPGGLAAIRSLVARGVVAAVGHTDASYEQTRAAVNAGARVATHLFNGMRPLHHRDPGPVAALLGAPEVTCELVADGVHLHPGTLRMAHTALGAGRAALVTDAIAAAGAEDGSYELGGLTVEVAGGTATLPDGTIAGSTLTMDAAVRAALAAGTGLADAVRMAATTPAAVLGLSSAVGAIVPGLRADLVVLDADLRVSRVMRAGRWVE